MKLKKIAKIGGIYLLNFFVDRYRQCIIESEGMDAPAHMHYYYKSLNMYKSTTNFNGNPAPKSKIPPNIFLATSTPRLPTVAFNVKAGMC